MDEPEVEDLDLPIVAEVDVRRLQIAMDDALRVSEAETVGDLLHDAQDLIDRQGLAALDELFQVLPLEELHHHVEVALVFDEVEDGDDVRMVELRGVASLALEAFDEIRIGVEGIGDDFDGDVALQDRIVTPIDLAHGALTDLADDVVLA